MSLVINCVDSFSKAIQNSRRSINVDNTITQLPSLWVDVNRLRIALANIIDNAVKYAFPDTQIFVHANSSAILEKEFVTIKVENFGDRFPHVTEQSHISNIEFVIDLESLSHISNNGFGLWESFVIINAHHGYLQVRMESSDVVYHNVNGYHTTISLNILYDRTIP